MRCRSLFTSFGKRKRRCFTCGGVCILVRLGSRDRTLLLSIQRAIYGANYADAYLIH